MSNQDLRTTAELGVWGASVGVGAVGGGLLLPIAAGLVSVGALAGPLGAVVGAFLAAPLTAVAYLGARDVVNDISIKIADNNKMRSKSDLHNNSIEKDPTLSEFLKKRINGTPNTYHSTALANNNIGRFGANTLSTKN